VKTGGQSRERKLRTWRENMERELVDSEWVCKPKDDNPITTEELSARLKRRMPIVVVGSTAACQLLPQHNL
jgi:hypothetical protein